MKNKDETATYTFFDHAMSQTVRSLSYIVGLRKITQPFWSRWLASGIRPEVIFQFLDKLGSIDGWANVAAQFIDDEISRFRTVEARLSTPERIIALRELSYLCNMAQWGSLPMTDERRRLYRYCRDFYISAESLAYPASYHRLDIPFEGLTLHANYHRSIVGEAQPLVIIVHGVDGCKEEFLSTELALLEAGFAVATFDGPGQGESLLLDHSHWRPSFSASISALMDIIGESDGVDIKRTAILGMSVGGLWAFQAAAADQRIIAVYDLGGPINTAKRFSRLPFLIKTRICQVIGKSDKASVLAALSQIHIEDEDLLRKIGASVRTMHGGRDRVVSLTDKQWLHSQLKTLRPEREATLRVLDDGDHCCTGHVQEVWRDMINFLTRALRRDHQP